MDVEKVADSVFKAVELRISKAIEPLFARLEALEARSIPEASDILKTLLGGEELATLVNLEVTEAVAAIPVPENGKDADPVNVAEVVASLADLPELKSLVDTKAQESVASYFQKNPVQHGRDAEPVSDERVMFHVEHYLREHPPEKGDPGKDGIGLAGAMIDREGNLIVTLANGEAKSLGPVVGKDGQNGKDGVGFESLEVSFDGEAIVHEYKSADRVFTQRFPIQIMKHIGFWRDGMEAKSGNTATDNGSLWLCVKDTTERPAYNSDAWTLAARKGRDGLDKTDAKPVEPVKLHGH